MGSPKPQPQLLPALTSSFDDKGADRLGHGPMVSADQSPSRYDRFLGSHSPALNRLVAGAAFGIVVGMAVGLIRPWELAVLVGWDAAAAVVLAVVWHVIAHADPGCTADVAIRHDQTRNLARRLLISGSVVSLSGVGFALHRANDETSEGRLMLVTVALLTIVLSWTLVNSALALHYAHLYYMGAHGGITFGGQGPPDFRDFAYLAFTIGMTYQVSDTVLQNRNLRRTALRHGLLAYLFGVFIVATTVNVIADFL